MKNAKSKGSNYSTTKLVIIFIAIALVVGGSYVFFGKNNNIAVNDASDGADKKQEAAANGEEAGVKLNPSGLDLDDRVRNVEDVEKVIAKWVEANPKAIIYAVANMQRKESEERMKDAQKNIGAKKDELLNDKNSPTWDRGNSDVVIVEFFDYACGYCKRAQAVVDQLIEADPKIKLIYKEFPILGQASEELATVAIAVHLADSANYKKFHDALMKSSAKSKSDALKVAASSGVNVGKVEATIKSSKEKIAQIIQANRMLGASIGVNGTPGFIIGDELIPGALDLETFKQKVGAERQKNSTAK